MLGRGASRKWRPERDHQTIKMQAGDTIESHVHSHLASWSCDDVTRQKGFLNQRAKSSPGHNVSIVPSFSR